MAAWLRVLANPKVLKRFLGTKAGKKATMKWGKMILESKMTQNAIDKLMNKNGKTLSNDKKYKEMAKEYATLQAKVAQLESKLNAIQNDNAALETTTFTLGRQVVEMRRLYQEMLSEITARTNANQMAMAAARTR